MKEKKFHYAWIVLLACLLIFMINGGLTATAFSVYLPHMIEQGGYSNTQITLINTIRSVTAFLTTTIAVTMITKLKPRTWALITCSCTAIAYFIFAFAPNLIFYYIAGAFLGVANGGGTMVLCSIVIRRWFKKGLGTAIGICGAGSAIVGTVVPPLVTSGVASVGLSKTFLVEAFCIVGLCVLVFLLMRNDPADLGMRPLGDGEAVQAAKKKGGNGFLTKREANIMIIAAFMVGSTQGFSGVNSLLIKGIGFDATQTAYILSVFGTALLIGKLAYGALHDTIGGFVTNIIWCIAFVAGLAMFSLWTPNVPLMVVATVLVAFGCCFAGNGLSCWAADLLPADAYDKTIGRFQSAYILCGLIFSLLPGPIADLTGSYRMVAVVLTVMAAVIMVVVLRAYVVNDKLAKAAESTAE